MSNFQLSLTNEELEALKKILTQKVFELREEIRRADDSTFKSQLREEKETLKGILKKLGVEIE